MGLKFSGLVFDPFSHNGFNFVIFQSFGKSPKEMDILYIFTTCFARIFPPTFKNFPETLSIPTAFEVSIHCKTSETLISVVRARLKLEFISMSF